VVRTKKDKKSTYSKEEIVWSKMFFSSLISSWCNLFWKRWEIEGEN